MVGDEAENAGSQTMLGLRDHTEKSVVTEKSVKTYGRI